MSVWSTSGDWVLAQKTQRPLDDRISRNPVVNQDDTKQQKPNPLPGATLEQPVTNTEADVVAKSENYSDKKGRKGQKPVSPGVVAKPSAAPSPSPDSKPSPGPSPALLLPGIPMKNAPAPPDYGPHKQGSCGRYDYPKLASFLAGPSIHCDPKSSNSQVTCWTDYRGLDARNHSITLDHYTERDLLGSPPLILQSNPTMCYVEGTVQLVKQWANVARIIVRDCDGDYVIPPGGWQEWISGRVDLVDQTGRVKTLDKELKPAEASMLLGRAPRCTQWVEDDVVFIIQHDYWHYDNPWHSLLDHYAVFVTEQFMNATRPFQSMRVYFADDRLETSDPLHELWYMHSTKVGCLTRDVPEGLCFKKTVFSLTGPDTELWREAVMASQCRNSRMLQDFSKRVISHLKLENVKPEGDYDMIVIATRNTRKLSNRHDALLHLQKAFPNYTIKLVSFGDMSLAEQIKIARQTNILIAVHGAELTHLLWMPEESAIIEIMPRGWGRQVFRNLAKFSGKLYIAVEAEIDPTPEARAWKNEHEQSVHQNVIVDVEKLGAAVAGAIMVGSSSFDTRAVGRWKNGSRTDGFPEAY
ncbi:hypothetical protein SeMB42_g07540 [Synchytrium endobioticum]|uniref:EGF domain-specific O-linked N-acetylglucosamine transferase n=1 Tax=Synchytrium endobioticum TaxID=286115 RepID=A0A507C670_9FUNG|nr:hypothetical protein SeMB42_g07540 [Synchytrium endobioticum]